MVPSGHGVESETKGLNKNVSQKNATRQYVEQDRKCFFLERAFHQISGNGHPIAVVGVHVCLKNTL